MTDPKKRLEEMLQKNGVFANYFEIDKRKKRIKVLRKALLKEFVHKDNLPSEDEIAEEIDDKIDDWRIYYYKWDIAKAIRKLIEGDRSV